MKTRKNRGFTLVEILIVVVILGILAAIVIPQFSDASTQANQNRLKSDLQTLRSQVQLYRVQNIDQLPDASVLANFETDMVPTYLHAIPKNPFIVAGGAVAQDSITEGAGAVANPGDGTSAWYLNTTTGLLGLCVCYSQAK